ncbi:2-dehydropantoate 2-reductase [Spinellus fusiger]|nr:2-dehydropantoate 2-reductase [Spinellus fusiger]
MHIHIFGVGAVGCYVASQIPTDENKVTLLLHTQQHIKQFEDRGRSILYTRLNETEKKLGFDTELINTTTSTSKNDSVIEYLVICTKAQYTISALKPLIHRLTKDSTVLILQNGMGMIENIKEAYWKNQEWPRFLVGVNRNTVVRTAPFEITHSSGWVGDDGLVIGDKDPFLQLFCCPTTFKALVLPWKQVEKRMIKKLVMNACTNPISALMKSVNGPIFDNNPATEGLMLSICQEASQVFGELLESPDSVYKTAKGFMCSAKHFSCSMLQDISAHKTTEVDYINGYLCGLASRQGKALPVNQTIVELIHSLERVVSVSY